MRPLLMMSVLVGVGVSGMFGMLPAATQDVSLAEPMPPPPVVQNPVIGIVLSLDQSSVWPSRATSVVMLAEFQNLTNEVVRWHKPDVLNEGDIYNSQVCLQRTDGTHFVANGTGSDSRGLHLGGEFTQVLAVEQSEFVGGWLGWGAVADALWRRGLNVDPNTGEMGLESWRPLEVGEYDVWVEFTDGPVVNGPQSVERTPVYGRYQSNRVHLSVVPEGTPMVQAPRLKSGPATGRMLTHRGTGLVTAGALAGYGITGRVGEKEIVLTRDGRTVQLPYQLPPNLPRSQHGLGPQAISISATKSTANCYVPLRYVAEKLGLQVRFDGRTRLYDLQPQTMPGRKRAVSITANQGHS